MSTLGDEAPDAFSHPLAHKFHLIFFLWVRLLVQPTLRLSIRSLLLLSNHSLPHSIRYRPVHCLNEPCCNNFGTASTVIDWLTGFILLTDWLLINTFLDYNDEARSHNPLGHQETQRSITNTTDFSQTRSLGSRRPCSLRLSSPASGLCWGNIYFIVASTISKPSPSDSHIKISLC